MTDDEVVLDTELARQKFFELSLELLCIASFDGYFRYLNPRWEDTLGWKVEELYADPFIEFIHPDDQEETTEQVIALTEQTDAVVGFRNRLRTRDGQWRWLDWTATVDREHAWYLAVARDVTDQVDVEHAATKFRAERDRLTRDQVKFFGLTLDLFAVAQIDGTLIEINEAWTSTFGHPRTGVIGRNFDCFIHPDDRVGALESIRSMVECDIDVAEFELRFRRADGEYRWVNWSAAVDVSADHILAVGRDTTDRRLTEEARVRALNAAEEANRAKSAFLANMSHELRTPLNSVIGFSNLLAKQAKQAKGHLDETQLHYVDRIRANGEHLLSLINDVLDLAKIEADETDLVLEEVEMAEFLSDIERQLSPLVNTSVELSVEVPDGLAPLLVDRQRLRQVLLNLIGNALKFTESGSVKVQVIPNTETGGLAPLVVRQISVEDTGPGISELDLATIFEPFRQLDDSSTRATGGTGLGLAITQNLCSLMGFELTVESWPGVGSVFCVAIPEVPASSNRAPDRG